MPNKIVVCLVGKSGSGKDSLAKILSELNHWHNVVSCTTRPKREYEVEGKDYYFLTPDAFAQKVINGDMIEATCFNNWHYGTMKSALVDGVNIGVWNPAGYECLMETMAYDKDIVILPYYLQCEDKTRLLRQLNREENPDVHEIIRRFAADEEDFMSLDCDGAIMPLWNENFSHMEKNIIRIQNDVADKLG